MPRTIYKRIALIKEFSFHKLREGPQSAASLLAEFNSQPKQKAKADGPAVYAALTNLCRYGRARRLYHGIYGPNRAVSPAEIVASRANAPLALLDDVTQARPMFARGDGLTLAEIAQIAGAEYGTAALHVRWLKAKGFLNSPRYGWLKASPALLKP